MPPLQWTRRDAMLLGLANYADTPKPNVLFYLLNHVRNCDFTGSPNVPTPNFERIVREGVRYTNAISTCPISTPFRAMLQTGLPPQQTGATRNSISPNFPPPTETLAGAFAAAGYITSYVGVWHLAPGRAGGATGPHAEFIPPGPARLGYEIWNAFNYHTEFARGYFYRDEPRRLLMPGYETDAESAIALELMQHCRVSNKPFFLMVSPHPPHPPWRPNQTPAASLNKIPKTLTTRPNFSHPVADENADPRCYYAQLHNADENLGRMLQYMDKNDLTRDTIVVVTSAFGEMLGSHGLTGPGAPYAESIDVPLAIRWPGGESLITPGSKIDDLFTPVDFLPKLTALAGLRSPNQPQPPRTHAIIRMFPEAEPPHPPFRAIRDRRYTFIHWERANKDQTDELYDNLADPYQLHNLAPKSRNLVRKFLGQLT